MSRALQKGSTADLIKSREAALAEIVGPKQIKTFMGNVLSQLQPTNAAGMPNKLLNCTPQSFYAAAHQAAILNLQPGPMEEVYLVPYGKKASLIIGYKGMLELARRHPAVLKVTAKVIYKDDHFESDEATGMIDHKSPLSGKKTDEEIIGAYCRAVIIGSDEPISLVMNLDQIEERRKRSAAAQGNFWQNDYAAMARKTVIRALFNGGELPRTRDMAAAIDYELKLESRHEVPAIPAEPVAKEVTVGFDVEPPTEEDDCFGLPDPNEKPAKKPPKPKPKGDKGELLSDIAAQAKRLKLQESQLLDVATDVMGTTVLDLETLGIEGLVSLLKELEGQ